MGNAIVQSATITLKDQGGGVFGSVPGVAGISSVSGTIADGETITINGLGFGSDGPENYMFENYASGILGSEILAANTNFDLDSPSLAKALRSSDSRSGSFSASAYKYNGTQWVLSPLRVVLDSSVEVFTSYAVKIPSGDNFPGNDGGNSGTNADYSTDSSWKTDWLLGPGGSSTDDDLVTPSHTGNGIWQHTGNDLGTLKNWGQDPTWWAWTKWNRLTTWLKSGSTPNVDAGDMYFQVANTEDPIFEDSTTPVIFANGTAPYAWEQMQIPGWSRERATQGGVVILYDDVYVAWGSSSAARVELGNASTYAACTDLAICETSNANWANGTLTTTAREGGLNLAANTWLYVTLPDNITRYSIQVVIV